MERRIRWAIGITALAAAVAAGACGDDSEQTAPMAPSAVADNVAGYDPASGPVNGATFGAPNGTVTGGSTDRMLNGGPAGDEPEGWSEPFDPGNVNLPPGMSLNQALGIAADRNVRIAYASHVQRSSEPRSVDLVERTGHLAITTRMDAFTRSYLFQAEWNRVGGACDTSDCTESFWSSRNVVERVSPRDRFTPDEYYWLWLRACDDRDENQSCDNGYTWSDWIWNIVLVPEAPSAPEPAPVPTPTAEVEEGPWICDPDVLCEQRVALVFASNGGNVTGANLRWRAEGADEWTNHWNQTSSVHILELGRYTLQVQQRDGDRRSAWSPALHFKIEPDGAA